jgi:hypothetical protein
LICLGDLKNGKTPCNHETLDYVDSIIRDNEFNDCNIDLKVALDMWETIFVDYETKYREPQFGVHNMQGRPEGFNFYRKRIIFFGLNLVGGLVHNITEWNTRHVEQLNWISSSLTTYKKQIDSVVIFAQASPVLAHSDFINPFVRFLRDKFPIGIPILF